MKSHYDEDAWLFELLDISEDSTNDEEAGCCKYSDKDDIDIIPADVEGEIGEENDV